MRLSFDLDGVVADTDTGMLALLHRKEAEGEMRDYWASVLQQYYARRRILHHPMEFCGPDDRYVLVSGRLPMCHSTTRRWVRHHLGGNVGLYLVSTDEVADLYRLGRSTEASELLGRLKAETLVGEVDVHFDNNPAIVRHLRSVGIPTVQVGGGLA